MLNIDTIKDYYNKIAKKRIGFQKRNDYYYSFLASLINQSVDKQAKIAELGCGTGYLLRKLNGVKKIGIDVSSQMLDIGRQEHPEVEFVESPVEIVNIKEKVDVVVLSDLLNESTDIYSLLKNVRKFVASDTKIIITQYNYIWLPFLKMLEFFRLKTPSFIQNYVPNDDILNFLYITDYKVEKYSRHILLPIYIPVISFLINSFVAKLPILNRLCLVELYEVIPAEVAKIDKSVSCSVIVACKEEKGNIRGAIERLPQFADKQELIFVDGDSKDGTVEEIEACIKEFSDKDVSLIKQIPNKGKGDAVRKGFAAAKYDVLMILDADLTVAPEDIPKFYEVIVGGKGTFVNGTRLVYSMEDQAMRTLNYFANRFFGKLFSYLLGQRITDTLCGTKVLYKTDYEKIVATRDYFGDFDPFGDFDLLFGASHNKLQIVELPIVYRNRVWGDIKIHRFRHGLILLKMAAFAFWKLKIKPMFKGK